MAEIIYNKLESVSGGLIPATIGTAWTTDDDGEPSFTSAKFGNGMQTGSGGNGKVVLPNTIVDEWTISMWLIPNADIVNGVMVDSNFHGIIQATDTSLQCYIYGVGGIKFGMDDGSTTWYGGGSAFSCTAGTPFHMCWVHSESGAIAGGKNHALYINGVLDTDWGGGGGGKNLTSKTLRFSGFYYAGALYEQSNCIYDDVIIFNEVKTEAQIQAGYLYENWAPPTPSAVVQRICWWL